MILLILLQMILTPATFGMAEQQHIDQAEQYEVVMYSGFPPEKYSKELKDEIPPEKALLTATVSKEGQFQAESGDLSFEGTLSKAKDGKLEISIPRSNVGSTSCLNENKVVKPNEAIRPGFCGFSGIIFGYYFRIRTVKGNGN